MAKGYNKSEAENIMNEWGRNNTPFVFIIDYKMQNILLYPADDIPDSIQLTVGNSFNKELEKPINSTPNIHTKYPLDFEEYRDQFNRVLSQINEGNSYLCNLTAETPIDINLSLSELYVLADAKYKLVIENEFLVFSPESFIKIKNGQISTFPMKGTINADLPNAKEVLLSDDKEMSEHATIVDLLRNDLSMIAKNIVIKKYRYFDKIVSNDKSLYQLSSEIQGDLPSDYCNNIGSILFKILPAGSITGAPKKKTVEIIEAIETHHRNYYTGVFGYFDGSGLESAVMIRYIEQRQNQLYYKSGGGITFTSNVENEYEELIDKIYVPIYRDLENKGRSNIKFGMA